MTFQKRFLMLIYILILPSIPTDILLYPWLTVIKLHGAKSGEYGSWLMDFVGHAVGYSWLVKCQATGSIQSELFGIGFRHFVMFLTVWKLVWRTPRLLSHGVNSGEYGGWLMDFVGLAVGQTNTNLVKCQAIFLKQKTDVHWTKKGKRHIHLGFKALAIVWH